MTLVSWSCVPTLVVMASTLKAMASNLLALAAMASFFKTLQDLHDISHSPRHGLVALWPGFLGLALAPTGVGALYDH